MNVKKGIIVLLATGISIVSSAQVIDKIVTVEKVQAIENTLASDAMRGRSAFTPDADKAADFISNEFKKAGLQFFVNLNGYRQSFTMVKPKPITSAAVFDGEEINSKNISAFTSQQQLLFTSNSGFTKAYIKPGDNFGKEVTKYLPAKENVLVIVDTSFSKTFARLNFMKRYLFKSDKSVVFVLSNADPAKYEVNISQNVTEVTGSNIVGVLPGKSKKDEYVIFSGHYDHLGVGQPVNGDSIYNGANDDAAGVTSIITMANYFKTVNNNERTLIFAAFTAEEVGGYGSQYFSRQLDANKVVAMFNMEMIGTESKWGTNSAYITGYNESNMGDILAKNLSGTQFKFYPDPYAQQNLFYRSDNATLARLGVPAHTISTSKMDSEPNYHKVTDEVSTLDLKNMTEIIKAVIISSKTIISGKDTPTRVNASGLTR